MKHAFIVNFKKANEKSFILHWSEKYIYAEKTRAKERYEKYHNLPISKIKLTEMFKWKNGLENISGNKTKLLNQFISKIKILKRLENDWDIDLFLKHFSPDIKAPIWNLFLTHILHPSKFPIYDQHVYRAQQFLITGQIKELKNEERKISELFFNDYKPYFNNLRRTAKTTLKQTDEALWAFGKFLKQQKSINGIKK